MEGDYTLSMGWVPGGGDPCGLSWRLATTAGEEDM